MELCGVYLSLMHSINVNITNETYICAQTSNILKKFNLPQIAPWKLNCKESVSYYIYVYDTQHDRIMTNNKTIDEIN